MKRGRILLTKFVKRTNYFVCFVSVFSVILQTTLHPVMMTN